jgi:signal transduction histidine kinase
MLKKKNEPVKRLLLKIIGVYRIVCLAALFGMILFSEEPGLSGSTALLLVWLSVSAVLYFVLLLKWNNLPILLLFDYFTVLLFSYFEPHTMIPEFIWIPGIIMALALTLPRIFGIIVPLVLGIPGAAALSWGFESNPPWFTFGGAFPFFFAALILYTPVGMLSVITAFLCAETEKAKARSCDLEMIVFQLNKLNHSISDKIFDLQNATTMEERKRLSKEIHDTAGYVFINLIMMLQAAQAVFKKDNDKAQQLVGDARDYAERGINEIRHQLRTIRSRESVRISLQNEFFTITDSFHRATEVEISLNYGGWPATLSKDMDAFFISFLQETLTNALKHGHASAVSVVCWKSVSHIGMAVTDNGTGSTAPIKFGIGITAMEDVIGKMHGTITIRNDKTGFEINAAVPLEEITAAWPELLQE